MKLYTWDLWPRPFGIEYYAVVAKDETTARQKVRNEVIKQYGEPSNDETSNESMDWRLELLSRDPYVYDVGDVFSCQYDG
ncbi:MAG: hypothetical protein WC175_05645 [Candidatus Dojkabacteria bacterium]